MKTVNQQQLGGSTTEAIQPINMTMTAEDYTSLKQLIAFWTGCRNVTGPFEIGDQKFKGVTIASAHLFEDYKAVYGILDLEDGTSQVKKLCCLTNYPTKNGIDLSKVGYRQEYGFLHNNTRYKINISCTTDDNKCYTYAATSIWGLGDIIRGLYNVYADSPRGTKLPQLHDITKYGYSYQSYIGIIQNMVELCYGPVKSCVVSKELDVYEYNQEEDRLWLPGNRHYLVVDIESLLRGDIGDMDRHIVITLTSLNSAWDVYKLDPWAVNQSLSDVRFNVARGRPRLTEYIVKNEDNKPYLVCWDNGYILDQLHDPVELQELRSYINIEDKE